MRATFHDCFGSGAKQLHLINPQESIKGMESSGACGEMDEHLNLIVTPWLADGALRYYLLGLGVTYRVRKPDLESTVSSSSDLLSEGPT